MRTRAFEQCALPNRVKFWRKVEVRGGNVLVFSRMFPPAPPVVDDEDATLAAIRRSMSVNCSGEKWDTVRTPSAAEAPGSADILTQQAEKKKIFERATQEQLATTA